MDLYGAGQRLLNGDRVRRRSWAPGRVLYYVDTPGRLTKRSLTLLTPHGAHRYLVHSIDARATDWEVLHGPPQSALGGRGLQG